MLRRFDTIPERDGQTEFLVNIARQHQIHMMDGRNC